jgi:L-malate glycosyltransferase
VLFVSLWFSVSAVNLRYSFCNLVKANPNNKQIITMSSKLKIAFFTFGFYTGGTERQLIELIKGLDRDLFTVYVAASRAGGPMTGYLDEAGIRVEYFPFTSLYNLNAVRQLMRLRDFLASNEINIMHNYHMIGNSMGVLAGLLARVPVILTSRRDMGGNQIGIYPLPLRILQAAFSYCSDAIVTNAQAIKQAVTAREGHWPEKIKVIPNGIDLERFTIDRSSRLATRRELGISEDAPVIGIVAEIKPVKGHSYLFQAARKLIEFMPHLRLFIIGDSSNKTYRRGIEAEVERLGLREHVIFLGRSLEVPRLLAALDVSVLPSLSEGISNSILESMAAGVPVVATDVGGNPEIVINEETGLLVPAADPDALAGAIERLLLAPELAARLATAARDMVENSYSNQRMVASFQDLYVHLAEIQKSRGELAARAGLSRLAAVKITENR